MAIKNRESLTHVNFLPPSQFQLIGESAGQKLVLIGRVQGYNDPVVALCETDEPVQEDLLAFDLYEFMKVSDSPVDLTANVI